MNENKITSKEFVKSLQKKITLSEELGIDTISTKELKLWLSQVEDVQTENIVGAVNMRWTTNKTQSKQQED